ncbi:MAG: hypothetical protein II520_03700, partial [Bacilli bacterium]|nr:hypothetical protein [Bacilli bacterium]
TAEGSTYLRQKDFREMLDACMVEYARRRHGLYCEFHPVSDAVIKGTAILEKTESKAKRKEAINRPLDPFR